ncbi:MAG: hypothetical protein CMN01_05450 [Rickettsiales bacterium]|nr:hypothetical protein [Rickettsiales bacterium]
MFTFDNLAVFLIVWWIVLFIFLPIGVSKDDNVLSGNDPGAPRQTNLKKKLIWTTISSLFFTLIIILIKNEIF